MDLEGRKSNIYYDQTGRQILPGDLLRVYHFRTKRKIHYMYHVVVMEETKDFPVLAAKGYLADNPHYRLYVVADNPQRIYQDAKIVYDNDWTTKRLKVIVKPNPVKTQ